MYASKLTLSDEFRNQQKPLTTRRKGGIMRERLLKADQNGELQKATSRGQVGMLAGCTTYKRGYAYASQLIYKGILTEIVRGFENGKYVYEYHLATPPKSVPKVEHYAELKQRMEAATRQPEEIKVDVSKVTETIDATIKINEAISVVLPMVPVDTLMRIVKKIMDKEA